MGGVKCVSLRPEKERENICFFYTVPILYSFIYSPIKRMGRSKERQRVQSLFISFNTNLFIFYPLFFLWIFLQQNTIFRTFVGWKKTLCKWQEIGLRQGYILPIFRCSIQDL